MNLLYENIEYAFTDEHSENDAIMIGLFSAVIDNVIKNMIRKQNTKVKFVDLENIDNYYYCFLEDGQSFKWDFCETLYLLKAYKNFTPKMQKVFDMYYLQDKPTAIIASEESCTPRAINNILKRCREEINLQRAMEEHTK